MLRYTFVIITLSLLFSACRKDPAYLVIPDPDASNSEASALLNGEEWYAYMNWDTKLYSPRDTYAFYFAVTQDNILRQKLTFDQIPLKVGLYPLSESIPGIWDDHISTGRFGTFLEDGDVVGERYHSSSDTAFHFFILDRYDPIKQEVEGRFQIELIKDPLRNFFPGVTPDTLRFTNGRFKLRAR